MSPAPHDGDGWEAALGRLHAKGVITTEEAVAAVRLLTGNENATWPPAPLTETPDRRVPPAEPGSPGTDQV